MPKTLLKVKANLSPKKMKLHKGQNAHVLSLPLGEGRYRSKGKSEYRSKQYNVSRVLSLSK